MKQSRRKFIEKAVLLSVGTFLFGRCKHIPVEFQERKSIIVIGAGISGLAAANKLSNAGHDVLVLEANNRIGDRISSVSFGGMKAELGTLWIHGIFNNRKNVKINNRYILLNDKTTKKTTHTHKQFCCNHQLRM